MATRAVKLKKAMETGNMKALAKAMTVRELKFCQEFVLDFKGKEAAIRAGYAPLYADRQAYLLKEKDHIRMYIDHLNQSKASKIMSVTPEYLIQRVTTIVNAEDAKDSDKLRGIEMLMRHLGMFVDRQEITGKDGGAIEVENRRVEEEAMNFTNLVKSMRNKAEKTVN